MKAKPTLYDGIRFPRETDKRLMLGRWVECPGCHCVSIRGVDRSVCDDCPPTGFRITKAFNAVRDFSYVDAL